MRKNSRPSLRYAILGLITSVGLTLVSLVAGVEDAYNDPLFAKGHLVAAAVLVALYAGAAAAILFLEVLPKLRQSDEDQQLRN